MEIVPSVNIKIVWLQSLSVTKSLAWVIKTILQLDCAAYILT